MKDGATKKREKAGNSGAYQEEEEAPMPTMMRTLLAVLAALSGCDAGTGGGSSGDGRRERYVGFAEKFGEALKAERYSAAYEMMASSYRRKSDLAAFQGMVKKAREKYGAPTGVAVSVNTLQAEGDGGNGLGFPSDVAPADRRARLLVRMTKGPDAINDCIYEVWINIADESGTDRIVTVEIPGIQYGN
jgi:hypothetical protein